ncbi:hypothetical protein VNO77_27837 [Canavalia gladiata]|uniref:DCD domain-containing protein n=1 Tax=Canavalia gladiata TaxID=3824 RepID=A0AAN9Q7F1_CANGL
MDSEDLYGKKEVSGHFPEYGAIFMSNRSTLKECFEKRLLGLPGRFSGFVRKVKAGMILFLFEFEERKLYGVFEAISDGDINIVPCAYKSTGREFPAQVKFTTIWDCDPLFEDEFRDAIQDNYFRTYRFNFGLSKDQIQSLLWLFDSRKLIQNSLHYNKGKRRKWDYNSLEDGLKKGSFTEIQISEKKLNTDHDVSVISEPEKEMLSLCSYSCRKSERIHFDDGAYDPEHPGFHRSDGSGAHSATSHESHEHLTLQQKEGNLNISAEESEDYIPLFTSDHSDLVEEPDFSECSVEKQIELGMFVGRQVSSIPVPQDPLWPIFSNEGYKQMKMEHPVASLHGSPSYCSAALPLSDANDSQFKDGSNHLKSVPSKSMYSDSLKNRACVFSRLNFSSKYASENQNGASRKLVNDMLRVNHRYHEKHEMMKTVTAQKHESGNCYMDKRTSVFLRLTGTSDAAAQPKQCITELKEGSCE